nr:hypothetical protein CFP56_40310 [Quercus suber]
MDLERVLESEPWTYDKHLVLFQRIDDTTTISSLSFLECSFWVQIHNLPIKSMTTELGISIGSSIGKVVRVVDSDENGTIGHSLWVRVSIDVSKPLKMDYPLRRPWSSSMGSEQAEYSQSRKSIPPLVKECPLRRVSGGDAGIPWSKTTQPDMAIRVGEPKSVLHAKPLFDDPKRFDETLQMIDSDLGSTADLVALP